MLSVEYNTVLIVIYIRRILESPIAVINSDRDDPVVLPCRMVQTSRVSFILHTEQALGITACLRILRRRDRLRILLRLRQIDRNINLTVRRIHLPLHILLHAVTADIVAVLTELVVIIGCFLRRILVFLRKCLLHLGRSWNQAVHQLRVE